MTKDKYGTELHELLQFGTRAEIEVAMAAPWLNRLIPGISRLIECDQGGPGHFEGDVSKHTSLTIETLRFVVKTRLGREATFNELLAALVHDLKKPETRVVDDTGQVRFPGHEILAMRDIPEISMRLTQAADCSEVMFMVGLHGAAHRFTKLSDEERASILLSPFRQSLALLHDADSKSILFPDGSHLPSFYDLITQPAP